MLEDCVTSWKTRLRYTYSFQNHFFSNRLPKRSLPTFSRPSKKKQENLKFEINHCDWITTQHTYLCLFNRQEQSDAKNRYDAIYYIIENQFRSAAYRSVYLPRGAHTTCIYFLRTYKCYCLNDPWIRVFAEQNMAN